MALDKHGYPRPVILKDGSEIWLRLMQPSMDRERLLDFYRRIPEKDRWYLLNDVSNEQVVLECILNFDQRLTLPIVAIDQDDRMVGKATLYRYFPGARGHIARVRVVMDPDFRSKRLGTYMLLDLIHLGVDMGLRLLIAELIKGVEDTAIRSARKLDFFEQAAIPDYAKDPRGNNYDLAIMVKRLHVGYDDY